MTTINPVDPIVVRTTTENSTNLTPEPVLITEQLLNTVHLPLQRRNQLLLNLGLIQVLIQLKSTKWYKSKEKTAANHQALDQTPNQPSTWKLIARVFLWRNQRLLKYKRQGRGLHSIVEVVTLLPSMLTNPGNLTNNTQIGNPVQIDNLNRIQKGNKKKQTMVVLINLTET